MVNTYNLLIMPKISAGLVMWRIREGKTEFLLVHQGGPFWKNKDEGAWSIPKGEVEKNEEGLSAAKREFEEETGFKPEGEFKPLSPIRQKSGKVVRAWSFEGDCDPTAMKSITFKVRLPWSGKEEEFPEADKAAFFCFEEAVKKINPAQAALLKEIVDNIINKR